jgi:hypothetical protein
LANIVVVKVVLMDGLIFAGGIAYFGAVALYFSAANNDRYHHNLLVCAIPFHVIFLLFYNHRTY